MDYAPERLSSSPRQSWRSTHIVGFMRRKVARYGTGRVAVINVRTFSMADSRSTSAKEEIDFTPNGVITMIIFSDKDEFRLPNCCFTSMISCMFTSHHKGRSLIVHIYRICKMVPKSFVNQPKIRSLAYFFLFPDLILSLM